MKILPFIQIILGILIFGIEFGYYQRRFIRLAKDHKKFDIVMSLFSAIACQIPVIGCILFVAFLASANWGKYGFKYSFKGEEDTTIYYD